MLSNILYLDFKFPNDAMALARYSLTTILKNIYKTISSNQYNQYTKAHLENAANMIETILNAEKQIN